MADIVAERHAEIVGLLAEIRDLLILVVMPEDDPETDAPCPHPPDDRISLAGFGEQGPHFVCRLCKTEVKPVN